MNYYPCKNARITAEVVWSQACGISQNPSLVAVRGTHDMDIVGKRLETVGKVIAAGQVPDSLKLANGFPGPSSTVLGHKLGTNRQKRANFLTALSMLDLYDQGSCPLAVNVLSTRVHKLPCSFTRPLTSKSTYS